MLPVFSAFTYSPLGTRESCATVRQNVPKAGCRERVSCFGSRVSGVGVMGLFKPLA